MERVEDVKGGAREEIHTLDVWRIRILGEMTNEDRIHTYTYREREKDR